MYIGPFNMIIPDGVKKNGSDVFAILDPDSGGAATFNVPLSPSGEAPATYWGTRTQLEEETYAALTSMTTQQFKQYVDQVATTRGRETVGSVTAFKNALAISEGSFDELVASLGLKRFPPPPMV